MTDEKLYELARLYGRNALYWRRKFMGLLPEVEKRKLYERKGCGFIFEFAYKLAGFCEKKEKTVLKLEKSFV